MRQMNVIQIQLLLFHRHIGIYPHKSVLESSIFKKQYII